MLGSEAYRSYCALLHPLQLEAKSLVFKVSVRGDPRMTGQLVPIALTATLDTKQTRRIKLIRRT